MYIVLVPSRLYSLSRQEITEDVDDDVLKGVVVPVTVRLMW